MLFCRIKSFFMIRLFNDIWLCPTFAKLQLYIRRWQLTGPFSSVSNTRGRQNFEGCVKLSGTIWPTLTNIETNEIGLICLLQKVCSCILTQDLNSWRLPLNLHSGRFVQLSLQYFTSNGFFIVMMPFCSPNRHADEYSFCFSCRKHFAQSRIFTHWCAWSRKLQRHPY